MKYEHFVQLTDRRQSDPDNTMVFGRDIEDRLRRLFYNPDSPFGQAHLPVGVVLSARSASCWDNVNNLLFVFELCTNYKKEKSIMISWDQTRAELISDCDTGLFWIAFLGHERLGKNEELHDHYYVKQYEMTDECREEAALDIATYLSHRVYPQQWMESLQR